MLTRPQPVMSIQAEVLENLRAQPIGGHTVADLSLPDAFLRRVADRITRDSFQEHFRVVEDNGVSPPITPPSPRTDIREGPIERRSFRARLPEEDDEPTGFTDLPPADQEIAQTAMRILASDGLLLTVSKTIHRLGTSAVGADPDRYLNHLDRLGIPIDLLDWFSIGEVRGRARIVQWLASEIAVVSPDKARSRLARAEFRPTPTIAGFRACPDSGQTPLDRIRVQIPFARYWIGPGDGGSLDLLRSLCEQSPGLHVIVATPTTEVDSLRSELLRWNLRCNATIVPVDAPVAQWARDNAREGMISGNPAMLLPRYATRGEPGAFSVPGEDLAAAAVGSWGVKTSRSPTLFQGGNLIVVEESGLRTLLAGEAEVWRNRSLGLSESQAKESLRVEMGCDRIAVLPAASFHIDAEVSVRATPDGVICFVADTLTGAGAVLRAALQIIGDRASAAAATSLDEGDHRAAIDVVGRWFASHSPTGRAFPAAIALRFSTGPADHGPSNIHRILHALDILTAHDLSGSMLPRDRDPRAYLEAIQRQSLDRRTIRRTLQDLGWQVVTIPCLPDTSRGLCPLNALHTPDAILMPQYGGALEPADAAAVAAYSAAVPVIKIIPVRSAESQRRSGALRCAVAPAGLAF